MSNGLQPVTQYFPQSNQPVVDISNGLMQSAWYMYFDILTRQIQPIVGVAEQVFTNGTLIGLVNHPTITGGALLDGNTEINGNLTFTSSADSLVLPTGSTAQRPASPLKGAPRYNTSTNSVEYYNGTGWVLNNTSGTGTVTSVDTGVGLSGGAIVNTGKIDLASTQPIKTYNYFFDTISPGSASITGNIISGTFSSDIVFSGFDVRVSEASSKFLITVNLSYGYDIAGSGIQIVLQRGILEPSTNQWESLQSLGRGSAIRTISYPAGSLIVSAADANALKPIAVGYKTLSSNSGITTISFSFLDSPSVTSLTKIIRYGIVIGNSGGSNSIYINQSADATQTAASSMILTEIKG